MVTNPFHGNEALVDHLAQCDEWLDVPDLPTGSGKMASIDVAMFYLALRAEEPRKAALRIVFVVDRHLVVDDAFECAKKNTVLGVRVQRHRLAFSVRATQEEVWDMETGPSGSNPALDRPSGVTRVEAVTEK